MYPFTIPTVKEEKAKMLMHNTDYKQ